MDIETCQRLGLDKPYGEEYFDGPGFNGRSNSEIVDFFDVPGDKAYHPCPEAYPDKRVPTGNVIGFSDWSGGRVYSQTKRNLWVYIPQQFDPDGEPPALMIFNDGEWYLDPNGAVRATKVLDSLIHAENIPITVAIFVNPGRPEALPDVIEVVNERRVWRQRSIEYDSVTETYGRFLIEDVIPFVEDQVGFKMSRESKRRTICGTSSGGICAFNTAWHFPEAFGCVLSHVGSFVNLRGGHWYPYLVRSTPRKPIRVFLQAGKGDVNIVSGNWVLANQQMASALEYAGYDMRFDFGEGGHSLRHGGAIFAESLRWLAREWTIRDGKLAEGQTRENTLAQAAALRGHNKSRLEQAIDHWNRGDLDAYLQLYDPNAKVHHIPSDLPPGITGIRRFYQGLWTALSDIKIKIDDLFEEGDKVALRYTLTAIHNESGNQIVSPGITTLHFSNGRCVERWDAEE